VDQATCLPFAGKEECRLCVDECDAAGYRAIEFVRVRAETDATGAPVPGSGFSAPVVIADRCVGCGLCQMRCYNINALEKGLLGKTAILVEAGEGKEDRLMGGSYLALREERERRKREADEARSRAAGASDEYLPEFLREK
jgi:Pyruvate/2-oxoacid:ferredoxin oxidoreductase delta subunit